MNKDISRTKKESRLNKTRNFFVNFGINYIKNWTKQELEQFKTQPVIIPCGTHGFLIGKYTINKIHDSCWRVTEFDDEHYKDFCVKQSAVVYCYYLIVGRYKQAAELLDTNIKLGREESNILFFKRSIKKSNQKKDHKKSEIMLNRYIDSKLKRDTYMKLLKKTLSRAKYINFGNQTI